MTNPNSPQNHPDDGAKAPGYFQLADYPIDHGSPDRGRWRRLIMEPLWAPLVQATAPVRARVYLYVRPNRPRLELFIARER